MNFIVQKMVDEKMESYCDGEEKRIEQFGWWCKHLRIDKENGIIDESSDVQMYYSYIDTIKSFVRDLAEMVPSAEFYGSIRKYSDEVGTEITVQFTMKKGKLEFDEIYPDDYYEYEDYDEDEDEDWDEDYDEDEDEDWDEDYDEDEDEDWDEDEE